MPAPNYRVVRADFYLAKTEDMFPPDGSADGRPRLEHFRAGPEAAAMIQLSREFDQLPEPVAGVAIKAVFTSRVPLFGPLVFYGLLTDEMTVALIDVINDPDYWPQIGEDPHA